MWLSGFMWYSGFMWFSGFMVLNCHACVTQLCILDGDCRQFLVLSENKTYY